MFFSFVMRVGPVNEPALPIVDGGVRIWAA
jgi:hypothetical protein